MAFMNHVVYSQFLNRNKKNDEVSIDKKSEKNTNKNMFIDSENGGKNVIEIEMKRLDKNGKTIDEEFERKKEEMKERKMQRFYYRRVLYLEEIHQKTLIISRITEEPYIKVWKTLIRNRGDILQSVFDLAY